jgi:hypothetical protein
MNQPTLRHLLLHYSLLISIFFGGGLALILFHDSSMRWPIIGILAATYFVWGIWHHLEHHSLTREVVVEFLAMLALICLTLAFIS